MFNALKYTQELEKAGFTREQAEISMKLLIDIMNENFATKSDLMEMGLRLESRIQNIDSRFPSLDSKFQALDSKIQNLESSLTYKMDSGFKELEYKLTIKLATIMGAMMTLAIGIIATLIKFQ